MFMLQMPVNTKYNDEPFLTKRGSIIKEGVVCVCEFDDGSIMHIPLNNLRYHYRHGDTVECFSVWNDKDPELSHLITIQGKNYILMCSVEAIGDGFRIDSSVEFPKYQ